MLAHKDTLRIRKPCAKISLNLKVFGVNPLAFRHSDCNLSKSGGYHAGSMNAQIANVQHMWSQNVWSWPFLILIYYHIAANA